MLQSENVKLPGGRSAKVFRAGKGPALVWMHGPHGVRGHDPVIAALADHYSVIAPLCAGFADLDEIADMPTVHDVALFYDDVFNALGLDRIVLAGHSFGAMMAAEYAAHYPRRVAKLVLFSPMGIWKDDQPLPDFFGVPYMTIDTVLWKSGKASPDMTDPADDPNNPVEKQVAVSQALTTVAKYIWPIPDRGLKRRLPRITADTLIVAGADDRFTPPSYVDAFAAGIKGARKASIKDAAHMAPYEDIAETLNLIDGFVGAKAGVA